MQIFFDIGIHVSQKGIRLVSLESYLAVPKLALSMKIRAKQKLRKFGYDRNLVWVYCSQQVASFRRKTEFSDRRERARKQKLFSALPTSLSLA